MRRRRKNRLVLLRRAVLIALVAIVGICAANVVLSSNRQTAREIVMSATPSNSDKAVKPEISSVQVGIAPEVEAFKDALAKMIDFAPPKQFQGAVIRDIQPNNGQKVIALTFDDGPWGKTTAQVLDILKKNDIKATFFWVGKHLQLNPDSARQVVANGHAIGNHTWSHQYHRFDQAAATKEIEDTAALIYKTTGVRTGFFRPPGGLLKNGLAGYAQQHDYAVMMWSVDSGDSKNQRIAPQALVTNVLKAAKPGGIVLMHDGGGNRSTTVQALPQVIEGLRKEGYKFVTLPELLAMQDETSKAQTQSSSSADASQN